MFLSILTLRRGWAALLLFGGVLATLRADDPPKPREQQITEIEKQLADLQKKLDALNAKNGTAAHGQKPLTLAEVDSWRSIRSPPPSRLMASGSLTASGRTPATAT